MAFLPIHHVLFLLPGISDRQWGKHGGWVGGSAAQSGYVLDSAEVALVVPMALAL